MHCLRAVPSLTSNVCSPVAQPHSFKPSPLLGVTAALHLVSYFPSLETSIDNPLFSFSLCRIKQQQIEFPCFNTNNVTVVAFEFSSVLSFKSIVSWLFFIYNNPRVSKNCPRKQGGAPPPTTMAYSSLSVNHNVGSWFLSLPFELCSTIRTGNQRVRKS